MQIDHVEFDGLGGQPAALVLRDPVKGTSRTLTDFTHIYFCLGRRGHLAAPVKVHPVLTV